jgi:hypothetical protein
MPHREYRVGTVPVNCEKQGGTSSVTFDFQLRPVGHHQSRCPCFLSLRFKDIVPIHEHGQGKIFESFAKNRPISVDASIRHPLIGFSSWKSAELGKR